MNWIKVEDRMPNYWFDVITCDIDGNVGMGYRTQDEKWQDCQIELFNITHWMPLPRPVKKKK